MDLSFNLSRVCPILLAFVIPHLGEAKVHAQGLAGIQNMTGRPFVTRVTPVIGPNGAIGGVSVDAEGVVRRVSAEELDDLRGQWRDPLQAANRELGQPTDMRMISLKKLDQAVGALVKQGKSPPEEMFLLAGLQRIEYVFAVPDAGDIVLAGPAEGWTIAPGGQMVGTRSGLPVLRLDDLMEALRTVGEAREANISCSIEPTKEGLKRYATLLNRRRLTFNQTTVNALEKAMGPQQVLVRGVAPDSNFARVMVAADYMMKLLAMGLEKSPLEQLPPYLEMLRRRSAPAQVTSPRWWMAVDYEPLRHSADGLAWQIRGQGLKTLTEDSFLNTRGERTDLKDVNPIAQQWADTMTRHFETLSQSRPVFGQLRNCVDLAVVAALLQKRDLWHAANCQLETLSSPEVVRGPQFPVPQTVSSQASFVRGRKGWIVSVSGGVEIDSWSVLASVEQSDALEETYHEAIDAAKDHWWW